MRLVIQRVERAAVRVEGETIAAIGRGLLVLVGVESGDGEADARRAADKVATLRVFADPAGKMNLDLAGVSGEVLAVSQFTLAGSIERGRRPGFDGAMAPEPARVLFDLFVASVQSAGHRVLTGRFGAAMAVDLVNDGPVTFVYDTRPRAAASGAAVPVPVDSLACGDR